MNWDDLRFFLAVKRAGSLAAAARQLKVDHSTVSRRISSLEDSLGAKLFERTPEGLTPTPAGRAITSASEHAERAICALQDTVDRTERSVEGSVRIATSPVFAEYFLVPRLAKLYEQYPSVQFEVVSSIPLVSLPRREADLAIRQLPEGRPPGEASVLAQRVGDFGFALYASEQYLAKRPVEMPIISLAHHRLVAVDSDRAAPGAAWLRSLRERPQAILNCSTLHLVASGISGGLGVGVIPCLLGDQLAGLRRLTDPVESFAIWLVVNPDAKDNPRIRAIRDAMLELIRNERPLLSGTG
jgi:DNA-binding transcriptional LysR family regulator